MKSFILIAVLHISSVLTACTKNEDNSAGEAIGDNYAQSCLLTFKEKLDGLLTLDKAAEIAGIPKEQAKPNYNRVMKNSSYHSMQYVWKSGRQKSMLVMGNQITVPVDDIIELHGLKQVTLDYFQNSHRPPTQQQIDASRREIDKAFDGKSDNEKVNAKVRKLDEMKVDKQTQKSTAGSLNSVFAEAAKSYVPVSGVGQAAAWNSFENRLYIYSDGIELSVTVDVSKDSDINKSKAITLAKALLKCP